MKVKFCGIKSFAAVDEVNAVMPDFAGFIFCKSRRQVSYGEANELKKRLSPKIKTVGVFADGEPDNIKKLFECGIIDIVQLHGSEDDNYIEKIKLFGAEVIKAVKVNEQGKFDADYKNADYILFDTYDKNLAGGTGKSFDWQSIKGFGKKPFFLAGGIRAENALMAAKTGAYCIDISGGAETDGEKDGQKMRAIMNIIKGESK